MVEQTARYFLFLDFYLDTQTRTLFRLNGEEVSLRKDGAVSQINFNLLLLFLQHKGQVLPKDALMKAVWVGEIVEENTLYKHVSQLRSALDDTKPYRIIITVPRNGYHFAADVSVSEHLSSSDSAVEVVAVDQKETKRKESYWLNKFWKPYFEMKSATTILYTQPLFFRHPTKRYFVRDQDINSLDQRDHACGAGVVGAELQACRHYVSVGEMDCVLRLSQFLGENGIVPKCDVEHRRNQWVDLDDNLIVIGNIRTNWLVRDTENQISAGNLEGFDLRIQTHRIEIQQPKGDEKPFYDDLSRSSHDQRNRTVYAVLSRLPSRIPDRWLTILAANNGWAFKAVAEFITDNDCLRRLAKASGIIEGGHCPDRFQILFEVDVDESEQFLGREARYITWRFKQSVSQ